jgi:uncharacterized protein
VGSEHRTEKLQASTRADSPQRRVLLTGVSTRAAAESAARAGFAVTAIDGYADWDQHPSVRALSLPRDFGARVTPHAAACIARTVPCDAVAYLSSFENHPRAVAMLANGRALWGNAPAVLRRARDPLLLMQALRRRGLLSPDVSCGAEGPRHKTDRWLVKPLKSGGGHGVGRWRGTRVPRGCYLQEFVDGTPGSIVFVAAGGRAVPLGVSCQLVGEQPFGSEGYRYCGNILLAEGDTHFGADAAFVERACSLVNAVAGEFGLVGVNGVDFVACNGLPYATEVNPRWSASIELVERAYGLSVFGTHADACDTGLLPQFDLERSRQGAMAVGKAVLFARRDVVVGDTGKWLDDASVRDVPHPGELIRAGGPVCTVFADGCRISDCHAALVARAARVYAELAAWERGRT